MKNYRKEIVINNNKYKFIINKSKHNLLINCLKNKIIIGSFNIYSEELFISGFTHSLSINIDEEYQNIGLSNYLIYFMVKYIQKYIINYSANIDMLFYIDVDASNGFWDYIGMSSNRYGIDYKGLRNIEGKGYEKKISFRELLTYINKKLL